MGYPLFFAGTGVEPCRASKCVVFSGSVCYNVSKDHTNEVDYEKEIIIFGFRWHITQ